MYYKQLVVLMMAVAAAASCGEAADAGDVSEAQAAALTSWYEEEKLAHEVYDVLGARWGEPTFESIQRSEATHMERVDALISKRGLDNPAKSAGAGVFPTPAFAGLYAELVERGDASVEEALRVGLYIEEKDIEDLELMRQEASEQDIAQTLDNQLDASTRHLQAFAGALRAKGATPQAQLLDPARFDQLLKADGYEP
jgi:hypothetical protein